MANDFGSLLSRGIDLKSHSSLLASKIPPRPTVYEVETPVSEKPKDFKQAIVEHEGLEPFQTPFKITHEGMKKWTSIFDDTNPIELNPEAEKSPGREGFLYLKNQEDLWPAIEEQFRRYAFMPGEYNLSDEPTIEEAVRKFDKTGANDKLSFLEQNGIDTQKSLKKLFEEEDYGEEE